MVKSHPVGTNGPWVVTPAIRSSSASERKKMMLIHANLSKIDDLTWTFWLSWHRFFREMAPLLEWPWNRRKSARSDSQWPVDTGRGAVAPVAGPRLVTGGLGRQPKAGLGQQWGQPQFMLQNLWQIRLNQHHLLPLWTRWRSYSGCDRPWPVGAGRVVSRLIKVTFYRIFLTYFSGKLHCRLHGLEIGKNPPDPILDGLLVPAGWSPGGLKLLFTVFSWRWWLDDDLTLTWRLDVTLSWSQPSFNLFFLWKGPIFW